MGISGFKGKSKLQKGKRKYDTKMYHEEPHYQGGVGFNRHRIETSLWAGADSAIIFGFHNELGEFLGRLSDYQTVKEGPSNHSQ